MRLGVNIDHVATLRQARLGSFPDPIEAARIAEGMGASSIVCHLREDRRHIQDEDLRRLKKTLQIPLNLEMSIAPDVVQVALKICPAQITLVPERRQELTTEGGLNVVKLSKKLRPIVERFHDRRISVSLFIDPAQEQVEAAKALGVGVIELHTGRYAQARQGGKRIREWNALRRAAGLGKNLGLSVAAGHGLDETNIGPIAAIEEIEELNIGFSIVAGAVLCGLGEAIQKIKQCIHRQPVA